MDHATLSSLIPILEREVRERLVATREVVLELDHLEVWGSETLSSRRTAALRESAVDASRLVLAAVLRLVVFEAAGEASGAVGQSAGSAPEPRKVIDVKEQECLLADHVELVTEAELRAFLAAWADSTTELPTDVTHVLPWDFTDPEALALAVAPAMPRDALIEHLHARARRRATPPPLDAEAACAAPRRPDLDDALVASPDDRRTLTSYAEWLLDRGGVRGRILAAEVGGTPVDAWRATRLRVEHEVELLGSFAGRHDFDLAWHLGFVRAASVIGLDDEDDDLEAFAERLLAFLRLPVVVALTSLAIDPFGDDSSTYGSFEPVTRALAASGHRALRALTYGEPTARRNEMPNTWGATLAPLAALPYLERLVVCTYRETWWDDARFPVLAHLGVTGGVSDRTLASITRAAFPALVSLDVGTQDQHSGHATPEGLAALARGVEIPLVRALAVRDLDDPGRFVDELLGAALAAQLERLELPGAAWDDREAVRSLSAAVVHLPALRTLVVDRGRVPAVSAAIASAPIRVEPSAIGSSWR